MDAGRDSPTSRSADGRGRWHTHTYAAQPTTDPSRRRSEGVPKAFSIFAKVLYELSGVQQIRDWERLKIGGIYPYIKKNGLLARMLLLPLRLALVVLPDRVLMVVMRYAVPASLVRKATHARDVVAACVRTTVRPMRSSAQVFYIFRTLDSGFDVSRSN